MVVGTDLGTLADVIFAIEGTAINGAYLNDIKLNYIIPTLEYFSQGGLEERDYICDENTSTLYGIVVYHAADRLPCPCTDIYGPYSTPQKFLQMLEKLELVGGRGESHANVAEALASSLVCFDDMQLRRDSNLSPQKHCILICNSPPYLMPVAENQTYAGNTAEQLASLFNERSINLTILSPRKIPAMFKLYEKAGGDLTSIQTKNYAKDPRHLVLLKGFSLKERAVSPVGPGVASPMALVGPASSTVPAGPRFPVYPGAASRQQPRWPSILPQRPQFSQPTPSSPLIEQLTKPPNNIPPQFNNSSSMAALNQTSQLRMMSSAPGTQTMMSPASTAQTSQQGGQGMLGQPGSAMSSMMVASQQALMGGQQGMMPGPGALQSQQMVPQQSQPPTSQTQPNPSVLPQQSNQALLNQTPGLINQSQQQPPNSIMSQPQPTQPMMQQSVVREEQTIWQGIIEWVEKVKGPTEEQKITRHVTCQVRASVKDGEPDIKADSWPQKLTMQLMPKQLIGTIGGTYIKNSKSVTFHPSPCEALDALTKIMTRGFAGCIDFGCSTPCNIKVLILLYTADKRAYLGFIPNDQNAFVDRLMKVIQQKKTSQALMRQQSATGAPPPGLSHQQMPPSLLQQSQQQPAMSSMMMQQRQDQQPTSTAQVSQAAGFSEAARQENLVMIQQLRQTLEAAQQQELQYKQLEGLWGVGDFVMSNAREQFMNQIKMQQMQDGSHLGQPPMDDQQQKLRVQMQQLQQAGGQPQQQQQAQQQQQRLMRPAIPNNPGLRHLLQHPQYRMQMQPQMRPNQPQPPQQQFDDVPYDFLS